MYSGKLKMKNWKLRKNNWNIINVFILVNEIYIYNFRIIKISFWKENNHTLFNLYMNFYAFDLLKNEYIF